MKKKTLVFVMSLVLVVAMMPSSIFATSTSVNVHEINGFGVKATNQTTIVVNWSLSKDKDVKYMLYNGSEPTGAWGL